MIAGSDLWAGASLQAAEVFVGSRARSAGARDRLVAYPGQDLVPEPSLQGQERRQRSQLRRRGHADAGDVTYHVLLLYKFDKLRTRIIQKNLDYTKQSKKWHNTTNENILRNDEEKLNAYKQIVIANNGLSTVMKLLWSKFVLQSSPLSWLKVYIHVLSDV